jgi:cytidylate kinase
MRIAIDGPSGAGKSAVADLVAKKLNILRLDTGAMYRAVGLHFLNGGDLNDLRLEIKYIDAQNRVFLNGADVTEKIRGNEAAQAASKAAALAEVRKKLVEMQQKIAENISVVMDGRDICDVVLPNADLKVFLDASLPVRAIRRYLQLGGAESGIELEKIEEELKIRDFRDSNREISPAAVSKDAVYIDATRLSAEQVADRIISLLEK